MRDHRPVRIRPALGILAVVLSGLVAVTAIADDDEDDRSSTSADASSSSTPVLSMAEIVAALEREGYSRLEEIELDDGRYEVDGLAADGRRVELYVDASSGEIVHRESDD